MLKLQEKIQHEAYVIDNRIVKVDHFINHMLDTELVFDIGKEFSIHFPHATKILTIESSGIAFAVATSFHLNHIPIVFARKRESLITGQNMYSSEAFSFTKQEWMKIIVDQEFINANDRILIIDDFLATGSALRALVNIAKQAGATIEGIGIVIEKGFLEGRKEFIEQGIPMHSLANIVKIEDNKVFF